MKKAIEIAEAFLKLSRPEVGDAITNLKLQKLLYYAQGFYIALYKKPLFKEDLLRWEHGPVVREIYDLYSGYGNTLIPIPEKRVGLSIREKSLIENIWKIYGQFSAWRLRDMTHNEMPWKTTQPNAVISHQKLNEFFKGLIVKNER